MTRTLLTALLTIGLLASGMTLAAGSALAGSEEPMEVGMGSGNLEAQQAAGVKPDYATYWVGPWTLESGWGGPNDYFEYAQSHDVTPAVHLYYWGDDISPECVENGCWSELHDTNKSREEWQSLTQQLVDNLWKTMDGDPVVIFLETEFNQNGAGTSEAVDGYLAEKATFIQNNYPAAEVVLPFGNWRSWDWHTFDRAAQAADYVGLQGMRGSTQNSWDSYHDLYEETLEGSEKLQSVFDQPIFLQDIALSSYPDWEQAQADELRDFFAGMDELKAAGVEAMVYRSWFDSTHADTNNYYGEAERHWGLVNTDTGDWKPAADVWVEGVQAERADETSGSADTPDDDWSVVFTPESQDDNWWIEVDAEAHPDPAQVEVRIDGGDWQQLDRQDWGHWATSTEVPDGASVEFRATSSEGHHRYSETYTWGNADAVNDTEDYDVNFSAVSQQDNWWVEVSTDAYPDPEPAQVEVRIDEGDWQQLDRQDWGHWATSTEVRDGASVEFRATSPEGQQAYSSTYTWGDPDEAADNTDGYEVEFSPVSQDNNWWLEVSTDAHPEVTRAEARVDGGEWFDLDKQDWGHWATSTEAPDGSSVEFRATNADGQTATSSTYTWGNPDAVTDTEDYDVNFSAVSQENNWWVEVSTDAYPDPEPAQVEVRIDEGDWQQLDRQDWGHWATSTEVRDGSSVEFRATSPEGQQAYSSTHTWGDANQGVTNSEEPYPVEFTPKAQGNDWWVEVDTEAHPDPIEVEARVDGGEWFDLEKQDWGSWGLSKHVEDGSVVEFRAISSPDDGHHHTYSDEYVWH